MTSDHCTACGYRVGHAPECQKQWRQPATPTKEIDRWNELLRQNEPFPCGDCGQLVRAAERHTWDDCRAYEGTAR